MGSRSNKPVIDDVVRAAGFQMIFSQCADYDPVVGHVGRIVNCIYERSKCLRASCFRGSHRWLVMGEGRGRTDPGTRARSIIDSHVRQFLTQDGFKSRCFLFPVVPVGKPPGGSDFENARLP